jgi:hypothetical protein
MRSKIIQSSIHLSTTTTRNIYNYKDDQDEVLHSNCRWNAISHSNFSLW